MFRTLLILSLISVLFSCAEEIKEPPKPDVYEIRDIGMLSTTEYTVGKIVKLDDPPKEWYKYGDRKILMSCKAKIKAGVNLKSLEEGDIEVSGNTVIIQLPPAEITSFTVDPKTVQTEMESITGFRDNFSQGEKNNFLQQAEESIRHDLNETSILQDAEDNAARFLTEFYKQLGYEEVIVNHEKGGLND